jgi:hypothetical protein
VASHARDCANATYDPLHMASSQPAAMRDSDTESLLNQSADPRLAWVNRQMYLSLRSLDIELGREQRVAECERPQASRVFEARAGGAAAGGGAGLGVSGGAAGGAAGSGAGSAADGAAGVSAGSAAGGGAAGGNAGSAASGGANGGGASSPVGGAAAGGFVVTAENSGTAATLPAAAASALPQSSMAGSTAAGPARSTLVRKSGLSSAGAGGNGATAQKISAGSDNDIVARRLRKAAEQETDPTLRAKLWKEYADYRHGMSVR